MKTLVLVRHAKSSWSQPDLHDHDRPLNPRGKRDAPIMSKRLAAWLQRESVSLDQIISSTARRALEFANDIAVQCRCELVTSKELYTFSATTLAKSIASLNPMLNHIAVVGHNPAMTDVIDQFSDIALDNLPTSGFVVLECDIDSWQQFGSIVHRCVAIDYPKRPKEQE